MESMGDAWDPPEGYSSLDCPNSPENNTLTCPYIGCDGFVFTSAEDCPYACGECGYRFAAAPALSRHARESGHQVEWYCRDKACEKYGDQFFTGALYVEHLWYSSGHRRNDEGDGETQDADSVFSPTSTTGAQNTEDDAFGPVLQTTTPGGYICDEQCCHRYLTDYKCQSELIRHKDTGLHQIAGRMNRVLIKNSPAEELEAEQEAIRNLRCNWSDCLLFGKTFKSARLLYRHLEEEDHRYGSEFAKEYSEYNSDQESLPGIAFNVGNHLGMCINGSCPRVGMKFDNYTAMKQHSRTFGHAQTEEDLASTDNEDSDDEIWQTSDLYGMEVTQDGGRWRCAKQGCKGYNKVIKSLYNTRAHFNSHAHATAAFEISSSDESQEELEGMETSRSGGSWVCVKPGCQKQGATFRLLHNARQHSLADAHALAEEPSSSNELEEQLVDVEYDDEKAAWVCTKAACKRRGIPFAHFGFARLHAQCASHLKAGENTPTPTQPSAHFFRTPKRLKRSFGGSLLTPIEIDDFAVPVTPGSPSAGRGSITVRHSDGSPQNDASTQTPGQIRIRRPRAIDSGAEKRLAELEKESQQLKDRVKELEGQMARVVGLKSPPVPRSPIPGLLAAQAPAAPASNARSSSLSSPASSGRMEALTQYVQQSFRPIVPMGVDEDEVWEVGRF
ncbi:hypothetical protein NW752_005688 [Fusarium irregulare]|uniref:C2H2-type domain-containing protein n=1 Tax=Fusarium irregulare TaxID=2494466 RepID=A0A9W8U8V9_9HYPO|nr:hypothetical protein NW766_006220 [Fusarium irregulare]KAJ4018568.1 hypothetical protein NW752_005688 [Fusarium irregulare]